MEEKLLKKIERLRKKLCKSAGKHKLIDSEVIAVSQELDGVLNQYQKLCAYKQLRFW